MERAGDSVRHTNKILATHEDALEHGVGSEAANRIADEHFRWPDGPVRRVVTLDSRVAVPLQPEKAVSPRVVAGPAGILELART